MNAEEPPTPTEWADLMDRAEKAEDRLWEQRAHVRGLQMAITAAIDSLTRWNGDDGSLVIDANIRHLRRALEDSR